MKTTNLIVGQTYILNTGNRRVEVTFIEQLSDGTCRFSFIENGQKCTFGAGVHFVELCVKEVLVKVKNYSKFSVSEYGNAGDIDRLGGVVFKACELENGGNPIGVIIQAHEDGDYRTDMFGNSCDIEIINGRAYGESRPATIEEIRQHRPELLSEINRSTLPSSIDVVPEGDSNNKNVIFLNKKHVSVNF